MRANPARVLEQPVPNVAGPPFHCGSGGGRKLPARFCTDGSATFEDRGRDVCVRAGVGRSAIDLDTWVSVREILSDKVVLVGRVPVVVHLQGGEGFM